MAEYGIRAVMTLKTRFSVFFRHGTFTHTIVKCFRAKKEISKKMSDFFGFIGGTLCKLPKIDLKYKEAKIRANPLDQNS